MSYCTARNNYHYKTDKLTIIFCRLQSNFECNADCSCDYVKYSPVCSQDGSRTFISACHAGCKSEKILPNGEKVNFIINFCTYTSVSQPYLCLRTLSERSDNNTLLHIYCQSNMYIYTYLLNIFRVHSVGKHCAMFLLIIK